MSASLIETGISFTTASGNRWLKHAVALDLEVVESRLEEPALARWLGLPLSEQILVVRAIEELMLCVFRRTRHDPDFSEQEVLAWQKVISMKVGVEGLDRVGV